jgi:hypothetical protein
MSGRLLALVIAISLILLVTGLVVSNWAGSNAAATSTTVYPSQSIEAVSVPPTPIPGTLKLGGGAERPNGPKVSLAPITPVAQPTVVSSSIPRVLIQAEAPQEMGIQDSDVIRVAMLSTTRRTVLHIIQSKQGRQTTHISSPYAVGTPGVALQNAFGAGYQAYASAQLDATQFQIAPATPVWQALVEKQLVWNWDVSPVTAGHQVIDLSVSAQWRPQRAGRTLQGRQIWSAALPLEVSTPLLTVGQFNITQFIFQGVSLTSLITMLVSFSTWLHRKMTK